MSDACALPLVIMGVAGSGKSTVAASLAARLDAPWLEGDDFHSPANRQKMAQGEPLTDADRASWLQVLCEQLQARPGTVILTCSALKLAYRERLREAAPGVRFAFLDITPAEAARRVASRGGHFFMPSLVHSQFQTLERPTAETDVLWLNSETPLDTLLEQICHWLRSAAGAKGHAS